MQEIERTANTSINPVAALRAIWQMPGVTVARLILESYFRSGWMWVEFVLVLVFFAALFFPFMENFSYFYGTSTWDLSALAVLGGAHGAPLHRLAYVCPAAAATL